MISSKVAMQAYQSAISQFQNTHGQTSQKISGQESAYPSFADTMKSSVGKVNDMQETKTQMVNEFAAGKNENVHELMIEMQKASTAMNLTSAVRGKVVTAYKELMSVPF